MSTSIHLTQSVLDTEYKNGKKTIGKTYLDFSLVAVFILGAHHTNLHPNVNFQFQFIFIYLVP